jgi:phenylacetate-CoA ligase
VSTPQQIKSRLGELLHSLKSNPFQRSRLGDIEDFSQIPFTTKAELAADFKAHPPYGSNLTYPLSHYTRFCQTSGTTAQPFVILDTPESWAWMLGNWQHIYREGGIKPGERIYFAFSFGPFLGFWTAFEAAAQYGCLCIPGGGLSTRARLNAIIQHRADALCCTPTYALHLAECAAKEGIDISHCAVKKIIVAGEPGGSIPSTRNRISKGWNGAEVLDHYGMTEVGPVAFQRNGEPDVLHVIEGSYFAEIIHPQTLAPIPEGGTGELVLTPLGRTAWPLLRYRTGDLVKRKADKGFQLDGGILGRVDDMTVIRGVNIYPSAVDAIVNHISGISEYRVTISKQGAMAEISVEIESTTSSAAEELQRAFDETFSLRIPVKNVQQLPRFEHKARRWVKQAISP